MKARAMDDWVERGARYLKELQGTLDLWDRPSRQSLENHPGGTAVFHDFEALRLEIASAVEDLSSAHTRLKNLSVHFSRGELAPFDSLQPMLTRARSSAAIAIAEASIAADRLGLEHPPKTRALLAQRAAVRLAYANLHMSNPRGVRAAAKRMMSLAAIEEPSERALTTWIKAEAANSI